ncbi:diacylglycerol acyltransferase-domain-containing protein [Talaromyces proteolyticus]|uniref:Diacylglycerol O-acyltransferase n=1 Tax=Talaromyces proteolyticus TaxID=1131652 RepID=A0AAD4KG98_9EURO|nr:diacylglycerol acyltransferase-domain-containing protein [Talaromyces proteolyticus]KAH8691409.1 diacylglycerol acyltransferase-domain-containing protein [Talaromyces proteolyticus]
MLPRGINALSGYTLPSKLGRHEYIHQSRINAVEQPIVTSDKTMVLVSYDPGTRSLFRLQKSRQSTSDDDGNLIISHRGLPGQQNTDTKNGRSLSIFLRFLQSWSVFHHIITIYPVFLVIPIVSCAIRWPLPTITPLAISVLCSYIIPKRRRIKSLRSHLIWKLLVSYFPIRLYRSTELPTNKKYIFSCHPHGILSYGVFATFATETLGFGELFPGIETTLLTLDSNFRIPVFRDYLLALGFGSVARESIEKILTKGGKDDKGEGHAVAIVVGGAKESLEAKPGTFRAVIKNRKGFIKLAIRTGADIVPVLAFGENDLYDVADLHTKPMLSKAHLLFKKLFGFTIPFFYTKGPYRFDFGIMPHRRPVSVVIGRPIATLKEQDNFNTDDIDEVHERYLKELEYMWNEWKDVFAPSRIEELTFL